MPNDWIFVTAPYRSETERYEAQEIYTRRMEDGFWGLGERTANRRHLRCGDRVIYYLARPISSFVGTARLASDSFTLDDEQKQRFARGSEAFTTEYGVMLENIERWDEYRSVADLAPQLDFIEDPDRWFLYLQGGVRQITEQDYERITAARHVIKPPVVGPPPDSLFALEAHLEEFIDHNWVRIHWDAPLRLFEEDGQRGRQYPAGTWNIDFLAVDENSGDFVVIELKRGQTSDATVGQVLRYISWVREHMATDSQNVRGIIVAKQVDDALVYAARDLPNVTLMTYSVTFALSSAGS